MPRHSVAPPLGEGYLEKQKKINTNTSHRKIDTNIEHPKINTNIEHRTPNVEHKRRKEQTEGVFFLSLIFFGSTLEVRRSMFDVRVSIPFGEALEVRRSMFDVRVFFFGSTLEVRRWMFAFSSLISEPTK